MTVAVAPGNEAAVALYRMLGFEERTVILERPGRSGDTLLIDPTSAEAET
jgi:hypothetical protein